MMMMNIIPNGNSWCIYNLSFTLNKKTWSFCSDYNIGNFQLALIKRRTWAYEENNHQPCIKRIKYIGDKKWSPSLFSEVHILEWTWYKKSKVQPLVAARIVCFLPFPTIVPTLNPSYILSLLPQLIIIQRRSSSNGFKKLLPHCFSFS